MPRRPTFRVFKRATTPPPPPKPESPLHTFTLAELEAHLQIDFLDHFVAEGKKADAVIVTADGITESIFIKPRKFFRTGTPEGTGFEVGVNIGNIALDPVISLRFMQNKEGLYGLTGTTLCRTEKKYHLPRLDHPALKGVVNFVIEYCEIEQPVEPMHPPLPKP